LGSLLAQGATAVKIMGESIKVGATIRQIDVYSGHADGPQLVEWVTERLPVKSAIFLTHGEETSLAALRDDLEKSGVPSAKVIIPQLDDVVDLVDGRGKVQFRRKPHRLPKEMVRELDWHNELADFTLRLREQLDAAADDKRRKVILRRVKRALDAGKGG
jgi:metallo-beta-lactamase family protein